VPARERRGTGGHASEPDQGLANKIRDRAQTTRPGTRTKATERVFGLCGRYTPGR